MLKLTQQIDKNNKKRLLKTNICPVIYNALGKNNKRKKTAREFYWPVDREKEMIRNVQSFTCIRIILFHKMTGNYSVVNVTRTRLDRKYFVTLVNS